MVWLAGAAYCDAGLASWQCLYCNGTRVSDVSVFASEPKNVRGYVGWDLDRARAIVAFRGTEPSSLENWLSNLDAAHAVWAVGDGPTRETLRVHAGFLDAYEAVRDDIFAALARVAARRHPAANGGPLPVAVTGHSLGGALATLAAYELQKYGFDYGDGPSDGAAEIVGAWTFGSPRVGDAAFAETYGDALAEATWRITHAHDVVPSVPVRLMGYHHVPTEVFYAVKEEGQGGGRVGGGDGEREAAAEEEAEEEDPGETTTTTPTPTREEEEGGTSSSSRRRRESAPPRVCDGTGEDVTCSDGEWTHTSVIDHLYYLDTYICGCNI